MVALLLALLVIPAWVIAVSLGMPALPADVGAAVCVLAVVCCGGRILIRRFRTRGAAAWPALAWYSSIWALILGASAPGWLLAAAVVPWFIAPNPAHTAVQPLLDLVSRKGGTELCDNGDPGRGPDNTRPWYTEYFSVPVDRVDRDSLMTDARVFRIPGTTVPKDDPEERAARLSVDDSHGGSMPLYCDVEGYGRRAQPGAGRTIIAIDLDLPPSG